MELNEVQHADFRQNGFMVVRNVLPPDEVETLRRRADEIISDVETYQQRDTAERHRLQELHKQDVEELPRYNTFAEQPEERITGRYARRGDRVYPVRQRPIDEAAVAAAQASDNPWQRFGSTLDHLADNDAVFRKFAAHPNVVKVLRELLAPNLQAVVRSPLQQAAVQQLRAIRGRQPLPSGRLLPVQPAQRDLLDCAG